MAKKKKEEKKKTAKPKANKAEKSKKPAKKAKAEKKSKKADSKKETDTKKKSTAKVEKKKDTKKTEKSLKTTTKKVEKKNNKKEEKKKGKVKSKAKKSEIFEEEDELEEEDDSFVEEEDEEVEVDDISEVDGIDMEGIEPMMEDSEAPLMEEEEEEFDTKQKGNKKSSKEESRHNHHHSIEEIIRNRPLQIDPTKKSYIKEKEDEPKPYVAGKSSKERYSDKELQEFRLIIQQKLKETQENYNQLKKYFTNEDDNGIDDTSPTFKMIEDGSGVMTKEEIEQQMMRLEKYIIDLRNALVRVENKTYGICTVTGKLIPKERLRSVPHATKSIEVKLGRNS